MTVMGESAGVVTTTCYPWSLDVMIRYLALGSTDGLASLWDLEELVCLRTMSRYTGSIRSVGFSYDGRFLGGR